VPVFTSGEALIDAGSRDVMFVCGPLSARTLTVRALPRLHVFCEKRWRGTRRNAAAMIDAARENGRFSPWGRCSASGQNTPPSSGMTTPWGKLRTMTMLRIGGVTRGWKNGSSTRASGPPDLRPPHPRHGLVLWLSARAAVETWGGRGERRYVHNVTRYEYPTRPSSPRGARTFRQVPLTCVHGDLRKGDVDYSSRNTPKLSVYGETAPWPSRAPEASRSVKSGSI